MQPPGQRLLGRLAELSWFAGNGEVAATRSIAMLLEHQVLRRATAGWLESRTGVDLSGVQRWLAEQVHVDRRRPDIEGLDSMDRPLVVIEAKFGAQLKREQLTSYLLDQRLRLGGADSGNCGLIVLLVPASRRAEAEVKLELAARQTKDEASWTVVQLIATWDELLDLWEQSVEDEPAPGWLRSDVEQLRAMCAALGGTFIEPFGSSVAGSGWLEREAEYRAVLDQVTRMMPRLGTRLAPVSDEPGFLARRYFPSGYFNDAGQGGAAALGLRPERASAGEAPIWYRVHRETPGFVEMLHLLGGSGYLPVLSRDGGHLWIPLEMDPVLGGADLVQSLHAQVVAISSSLLRDAYGNRT